MNAHSGFILLQFTFFKYKMSETYFILTNHYSVTANSQVNIWDGLKLPPNNSL